MSAAAPLIVTLALDEASFDFFNALRKAHFPPERNYLQAHLTLFHHLPGDEPSIFSSLQQMAAQQSPLELAVANTAFIGRGVAYKIESVALQQFHAKLQQLWKHWLTPQDAQKLWPHVTVQNKVSPDEARALHKKLTQGFQPFTAVGTGFSVWEYKGGPWQALATFPFFKAK